MIVFINQAIRRPLFYIHIGSLIQEPSNIINANSYQIPAFFALHTFANRYNIPSECSQSLDWRNELVLAVHSLLLTVR